MIGVHGFGALLEAQRATLHTTPDFSKIVSGSQHSDFRHPHFSKVVHKAVKRSATFKMVYLALLVAFAVAVHTVEAAIPVPVPVPGAKLGLANIITLLAIVFYGWRSGLVVAALRSVLGSLLIGNFLGFGFYLSFSGALASSLLMALFMPFYYRQKISLVSVSLAGAVTFNIVQLALASLLVQNMILFRGYLPFLLLLALPTGLFTGLAAIYLEKFFDRAGLQFTVSCKTVGLPAHKATTLPEHNEG